MNCNRTTRIMRSIAPRARALGALLLAGVLLLASSLACAQSVKPPVNLKLYNGLVRQAVEQYERGNYDESKVLFAQAHQVFPNARTLRGLGMVAYTMRDYVEAIHYLEGAIDSQVKPLDPPLISESRDVITRARTFIGVVRVSVVPEDARLRVNASPAARTADGTIALNPGPYEIEASAPGHQTASRLVRVDPGTTLIVEFALPNSPAGAVAAAAGQPQPEAASPEPQIELEAESEPSGGKSVAPWILVGVSGAVAIAGGVMLGIALNDVSTVEHTGPTTDWSEVEGKYQRSPVLSTVGIAMLGAGAAGIAAGLTWHFLEPDESEPIALDVSPFGATLRAKW
jgi:hypothetical protein